MDEDKPRHIIPFPKPCRIVRFKVDKDNAQVMIPQVYSASSPATQGPSESDTSPPRTPTPAMNCGESSGRVSSNNDLTKALNRSGHHSDHADASERGTHRDSRDHHADGLVDRIQFSTVDDPSAISTQPTQDSNDEAERWNKRKAVLPKEQNDVTSQTAILSHEDRNTILADRKAVWIDEDHDGMDGTDDAAEELLLLSQELVLLEAKKGNRFWKATDEARYQETMQRIKMLETAKPKSDFTPNEDDSRARAAAQILMPLTLDGFHALSSAKGSNAKSKKTKMENSRKRKAAERSVPGTGPGPAQKKQRVAKSAVNPSKSKTSSAAPIPNLLKLNGNGEDKISKETLKDLPSISKAPAHVKTQLQQIQACAMKRPGVDKDTITAHIRLLVSMTKIFRHQVQPRASEVKEDEKTLDDYRWDVKGMKNPLYHHQLVAAAFMVGMERNMDETRNGSGLLFDHMGYGKTIEALSLIVSNRPDASTSEENGERLTVVVCPTNVGRQWVGEIENHCCGLKAALWCETLEATKDAIFGFDVLVVTYERLREIYKKGVANPKRKSVLFQAKLHRLILDEIHEIKSPKADSVTFRACIALTAKHYWGLSGTPTPNGIEELYPYLLFIRHPDITTLSKFKACFVGGKGRYALSREERNSNLTEQLGAYILLRTPKHKFLGEALVNLPEAHEIYKTVQLGKEERIIYKKIDSDMKAYITKKAGKRVRKRATKNNDKKIDKLTWANLWESALRFRQCVASPLLLENLVKDGIWTRGQVQAMKAQALSEGCSETPFIDMIDRWIDEPSDSFSQKIADAQRLLKTYECPSCRNSALPEKDPQQASCDHIWCKQCLVDYIDSRKHEAPDQEPTCPRCSTILGEGMKPPHGHRAGNSSKRSKNMPRQPGDDYNGYQPKPSIRANAKSPPKPTLFEHLDSNPTAPIPLSAKMSGIVDQVLAWQKEAAPEKIIIFTQFIDVNRLIARTLQKKNIEFLYFTGGMGEKKRAAARTSFADVSKVKVMLVSLKCGGQALNLTQSNRVIIADPWWNRCVEQQAFARVHRIGQKKETYAVRFLADDTIDSRMHELQQQKLDETQDAIEEFQADKSLGPRTLRMILGKAWYDEEVNDDEVSDYEGEEEGVDCSEELPADDDDDNVEGADLKG